MQHYSIFHLNPFHVRGFATKHTDLLDKGHVHFLSVRFIRGGLRKALPHNIQPLN